MGTPKCQLWENFNKNSKAIAKAKGMDTIVLAEKSGMSRQSIYSYWSGRLMPGLKRIEKIAAVLGVDPITLFEDPKSIDVKDIVAGGDGQEFLLWSHRCTALTFIVLSLAVCFVALKKRR